MDAGDLPICCLLVLAPAVAGRVLQSVTAQSVLGVRFIDAAASPTADADADRTVVLHRAMYDVSFEDDEAACARLGLTRRLAARCALVDPLECVLPFANRGALCSLISRLAPTARQPRWLVVGQGEDAASAALGAGLRLPIVCKPLLACGPPRSHELAVAMQYSALRDCAPPLLLQEYVPHGGRLFKAYYVGGHLHCEERQSLPDLLVGASGACGSSGADGPETPALVRFCTQAPPPTAEEFGAAAAVDTATVPEAAAEGDGGVPRERVGGPPREDTGGGIQTRAHRAAAMQLVEELAQALGVSLLGVDVIVPTGHDGTLGGGGDCVAGEGCGGGGGGGSCGASATRLLVVDLNYFPNTCLQLGDGGHALARLVRRRYEQREASGV